MSNANTTTTTGIKTPYCFRCQQHPDLDDPPLKRCGSCHSRRYCSRECQRNDWPRHRDECCLLAQGKPVPNRQRTTMRLNWHPWGGPGPDTICYLKTSRPHLKDVSLSGPYYPFDRVFGQMFHHMAANHSPDGHNTLTEMLMAGTANSLQRLNAPLEDGNVMHFELIREENPEVARRLPGEVWCVFVATPHPDMYSRTERRPEGFIEASDMEVRGTFTTGEAANVAAIEILEKLKAEAGPQAGIARQDADGLVKGGVYTRQGGTLSIKLVEARHETGSVTNVRAG
ncbi:uncharacterized protein PV06_05179 [Exophiala oligosperma]|uniref:MYND-type domain-containing protein n=1 Tax=Exophiala oligosperma TaxID=215243 RepID=A0A0D2AWG1_9EURO|nr:uncharacterized protein PV06_05179 [Exophiala oligosperma]KIW44146.1 hypothetical protein PV06_05179 [Exophiala oligosperma]